MPALYCSRCCGDGREQNPAGVSDLMELTSSGMLDGKKVSQMAKVVKRKLRQEGGWESLHLKEVRG